MLEWLSTAILPMDACHHKREGNFQRWGGIIHALKQKVKLLGQGDRDICAPSVVFSFPIKIYANSYKLYVLLFLFASPKLYIRNKSYMMPVLFNVCLSLFVFLPCRMLRTYQMRPNPVHVYRDITQLTRPCPTFMKRLHRDREVGLTRLAVEFHFPLCRPGRGGCHRTAVLQRPLMDVARIRMHDQLT